MVGEQRVTREGEDKSYILSNMHNCFFYPDSIYKRQRTNGYGETNNN